MAKGKSQRAMILARNQIVGEGLRSLLPQAGIAVVALAYAVEDVHLQIPGQLPDLLFLDAALCSPDSSTLEALGKVLPGVRCVILCVNEAQDVAPALAHGASAYLCDDVTATSLRLVAQAVTRGYTVLDRPALADVLAHVQKGSESTPVLTMTPRQRQVLTLVAQGLRYREIAARLDTQVATVRVHVRHILRKLNVPDRAQAVACARRQGLLQPPPPVSADQTRLPVTTRSNIRP